MLMILLSMLSDEGDRRKLFELYTQYQDAMLRVARRYFPADQALAEDAVQNAWLRVIDNFRGFSKFLVRNRALILLLL